MFIMVVFVIVKISSKLLCSHRLEEEIFIMFTINEKSRTKLFVV